MNTANITTEELTRELVYSALQGVIDPEVGINIVDLGLVYQVNIGPERVEVTMTLTTPACPMGSHMVDEAQEAVQNMLQDSLEVDVRLAWDPQWGPDMMSEKAKQLLGWR